MYLSTRRDEFLWIKFKALPLCSWLWLFLRYKCVRLKIKLVLFSLWVLTLFFTWLKLLRLDWELSCFLLRFLLLMLFILSFILEDHLSSIILAFWLELSVIITLSSPIFYWLIFTFILFILMLFMINLPIIIFLFLIIATLWLLLLMLLFILVFVFIAITIELMVILVTLMIFFFNIFLLLLLLLIWILVIDVLLLFLILRALLLLLLVFIDITVFVVFINNFSITCIRWLIAITWNWMSIRMLISTFNLLLWFLLVFSLLIFNFLGFIFSF